MTALATREEVDVAERLRSAYQEALDADGDLDLDAVSQRIDRMLYREARAAYVAYLREHARKDIREQLRQLDMSRRASARHQLRRSMFGDTVTRLRASGDLEDRLAVLDRWRVDIGDGVRRPVMELTGSEHLAEAERHERLASTASIVAAFHRYVGERCAPDAATSMSRQEVADLWRRLAGDTPIPVGSAA